MDSATVDQALWLVSTAGQIVLSTVLISRSLYRSFPIFTIYLVYSTISDIVFFAFFRHWDQKAYFDVYFVDTVLEFMLQIGILLEVARNVLVPVRRSLPATALYVLAGMLVSGTVLALLLSFHHTGEGGYTRWYQYFMKVNLAVAILRLVIFSAIALFSQMLGIGWRNHVLQIATGFASYSFVILLVELTHRYSGMPFDYHFRFYEEIRVIGWCLALGYWSYSLAKKEAPRKEFSPKMANFLISVAEVAKNNRADVARWHQK